MFTHFKAIALAAALALTASPAIAQTADPLALGAEDRAGIETAVWDYFHGQGMGDAARMNRAFLTEHAAMVGVRRNAEGEYVDSNEDMGAVIASWSRTQNPNGGSRDGEILSIDVVDGRLAVVLFRSTTRYYDALTLIKVDGAWRIVSKAFVTR